MYMYFSVRIYILRSICIYVFIIYTLESVYLFIRCIYEYTDNYMNEEYANIFINQYVLFLYTRICIYIFMYKYPTVTYFPCQRMGIHEYTYIYLSI
jgi:hypothetical protein